MNTVDGAARILVIEDDPTIRAILRRALEEQSFAVHEAADGTAGLDAIESVDPALVLLDLGLPGINGLDVLREVRRRGNLPVIILTARDDPFDRVTGLELGADDYVVKPFTPREVTARVRSVLRRAAPAPAAEAKGDAEAIRFDTLEVHPGPREVLIAGEIVELTAKEFDLLLFLVRSPRQVFTREQLLDQVWRSQSDWQDPDTITEHIHRLRRKIEADPKQPKRIMTVRGVGYRFEP